MRLVRILGRATDHTWVYQAFAGIDSHTYFGMAEREPIDRGRRIGGVEGEKGRSVMGRVLSNVLRIIARGLPSVGIPFGDEERVGSGLKR